MADETVYKSLHTGGQIDEAIASALEMKKNGPFLPLKGGTMQGSEIIFVSQRPDEKTYTSIDSNGVYIVNPDENGVYINYGGLDSGNPVLSIGGVNGDEPVIMRYIASPVEDLDAANKSYVDQMATPLMRTVALSASGWSNKAQTVTVAGVLADETKQRITPIPASSSQAAYIDAVVICTAQGANSLTFTCDTIPTADLTIYVTVEEVRAE